MIVTAVLGNKAMIQRTGPAARAALLLVMLLTSGSLGARAQQTDAGSVRGRVTDVNGALVVGASVTLAPQTGTPKSAQTNGQGEFSFLGVVPGTYTLRVTQAGFAPYEKSDVVVAARRAVVLEVSLGITLAETQVTVSDEPAVNTDPEASAGAIVLKDKDIEALPDDAAELEAALRALAGPGAGPSGGEIFIDGFSGGRLPPRDSIREIRINQNPFSSEFDRLGFGRIEILTKPGTDDFRGEVDFEFEDESLNSRNPFAPSRVPFQVRNVEGNLAGPIIKKRASFFIDAGIDHTDDNALINAIILDPNLNPTPFALAVVRPSRDIEIGSRFDFAINEQNTLMARYNFERGRSKNSGIGGFDLLSRSYSDRNTEHTFRVTETAVLSPTVINETRFQFITQDNSQEAADNSPTIRVLDAFTGGGANIGNAFSSQKRFEFHNNTSMIRGRHTLKFGARVRHIKISNASPSNFAGTFTFTSIQQYRDTIQNLPGAFPTQFTIAGGEPVASVSQTDLGLFIQDDWRYSPALTLSFGLRYENQTNISSGRNIAPRFSFAWAHGATGSNRPKTVFRAGAGLFYERFGESLTLQARRFNGINQQQFIITDPAILDAVVLTPAGVSGVPSVASLTSLPQTTRIVSEGLETPLIFQTVVGVERQLPLSSTLSVSYVHSQTRRLLRSRNINAPINGVQPIAGGGTIFQYESTGRAVQDQLIFNFRTRFVEGVSIFANYALGRAKSDTDGSGTFPINQYDLSGEYGNALIDIRHRFTIGGNFELPYGFELSPFITYRSGVPFNITTGTDTNGDNLFTERPKFAQLAARCGEIGNTSTFCDVGGFDQTAIVPRNFGRGPDFFMTNLRVSKEFQFGKKGGKTQTTGQGGGGGRQRGGINDPFGGGRGGGGGGGNDEDSLFNVQFSVSIRNLFNKTNFGTPVGNLRSPFFGRPVSSAGGFGFGGGGGSSAGNRRLEFEIEFSF
jgi:hypothetical protein